MDTLLILMMVAIIVAPPLGWIVTVLVALAMFDRSVRLDISALTLAVFALLLNVATVIVLWSGSAAFLLGTDPCGSRVLGESSHWPHMR